MLFHSFHSQAERREFGGSDDIEIQYCRLPEGTSIREILSVDAIENWRPDSLYICGGDMDLFYQNYGDIITGGVYNIRTTETSSRAVSITTGIAAQWTFGGSTSIPKNKPVKSWNGSRKKSRRSIKSCADGYRRVSNTLAFICWAYS